ncbi:MAG: hypothetical protein EP338_06655 [Bacteroidetes bacterium]|nr:MAG: hypothetical protein EP338_06655 [Bacteroidota bacterium]
MKQIQLLLSLLFLASCQGDDHLQTAKTPKPKIETKPKTHQLSAYCFYQLDEKYSSEEDSSLIVQWMQEKSELILQNKIQGDIFAHEGGGPNGAEWNPSTDLYIALLFPEDKTSSSPKLQLNGRPQNHPVFEYNPHFVWYRVKEDFWVKQLKQMDSTEMRAIYPDALVKSIETGQFEPIADLMYGEILKFDISFQEESLIRFFHATFGE